MTRNKNPLGETPEEFVNHCRQYEADNYPIRNWVVGIGASHTGSLGASYVVKRTYKISARRCDLFDAAISRAYEDGDIEHVRVEYYRLAEGV